MVTTALRAIKLKWLEKQKNNSSIPFYSFITESSLTNGLAQAAHVKLSGISGTQFPVHATTR